MTDTPAGAHRFKHGGGCHCGRIRYQFSSPGPLSTYSARARQCGFCAKHGAACISDPAGALAMDFESADVARLYRQGSNQADFLLCQDCAVLVAAMCRIDRGLYAAINSRTLDAGFAVQCATVAGLDAADTASRPMRWQKLWIAAVQLSHPIDTRLDD